MTSLQEADESLDAHDYPGAVNSYRAAMRSHEPPAQALGNLGIAEEAESLQFRAELVRLYGGSLPVRMDLARRLLASKKKGEALDCCTRALQDLPVDFRSELLLRRLRLEAALASGDYGTAVGDFGFIWKAGERMPASRAFRERLLSLIASVTEPRAVEFMDGIRLVLATAGGRALLDAKSRELTALGAAINELGLASGPAGETDES